MEQQKQIISTNKLTEAGCHQGLQSRRWNPLMKNFIKSKKGNFHIFDLQKTLKVLENAYNLVYDVTKKGGSILFVGTKNKALREVIKEQAKRAKSFYVSQRWLGGTLTNFKTINNSIKRLNDLVALDITGDIAKYPKKEQIQIQKEIDKLIKFIGGIRTMRGMPDLVIILDPKSEPNAVSESKKTKYTYNRFNKH